MNSLHNTLSSTILIRSHNRILSHIILISLILIVNLVNATDQYNYKGCYNSDDVQASLTSMGHYQYESIQYCQESCAGALVAALFDGSNCYCGNSLSFLDNLSTLSDDKCNVACAGWPYQMCGGDSAMNIFINAKAATSSSSSISSTSSKSSSSSSSKSSTSSSLSSSSSSSKTTRASSSSSTTTKQSAKSDVSTLVSVRYTTSVVTQSVVTTSNQEPSTILVTSTRVVQLPTDGSTDLSTNDKSTKGGHNKLSGGAIAGIVIGVVFGVIIMVILLLMVFLWHRRNNKIANPMDLDLAENKQYQPYSFGEEDATPVVIPPTITAKPGSLKHVSPPKPWALSTKNTKASNSSNNSSAANNQSNNNLLTEEPIPSTMVDENKTHTKPNQSTNIPVTFDPRQVPGPFEEPVIIYTSETAFSATSLQDIPNENKLRIVNPDDPVDLFSNDNENISSHITEDESNPE